MEYGLDYAMHRHDIERIERVLFDDVEVNNRMADGQKPLHMGHDGDGDLVIVFGIPRPKECSKHAVIKEYYLRDDSWNCPTCLAEQD